MNEYMYIIRNTTPNISWHMTLLIPFFRFTSQYHVVPSSWSLSLSWPPPLLVFNSAPLFSSSSSFCGVWDNSSSLKLSLVNTSLLLCNWQCRWNLSQKFSISQLSSCFEAYPSFLSLYVLKNTINVIIMYMFWGQHAQIRWWVSILFHLHLSMFHLDYRLCPSGFAGYFWTWITQCLLVSSKSLEVFSLGCFPELDGASQSRHSRTCHLLNKLNEWGKINLLPNY